MHEENKHHQVLRIKNMVCPRCIKVVRCELENLGVHVLEVELGMAVIQNTDDLDLEKVESTLNREGFELLQDRHDELIETIKLTIIDLIYNEKISAVTSTMSNYLARELGKDYSTLSTAFKASEGIVLNKYIVLQKIERAKELLAYDELPLAAIATKIGYKSQQHLSSQFKEVTGMTPNTYKKQVRLRRKTIDNLY